MNVIGFFMHDAFLCSMKLYLQQIVWKLKVQFDELQNIHNENRYTGKFHKFTL